MSERISVSEFARRDGCDEKLVRRAVKEGRLTRGSDKKLDASLVGTGWRAGNAGRRPGARTTRTAGSDTVRSDPPAVGDDETPQEAAERIAAEAPVVPALGDSLARKEYFLALLRELEYQQKDGALVDLSMAEQVLFETARAARDAWLNFPTKVGPQLAAQLGLEADKVTEALSAYVHKQIAELGEPEADFSER